MWSVLYWKNKTPTLIFKILKIKRFLTDKIILQKKVYIIWMFFEDVQKNENITLNKP